MMSIIVFCTFLLASAFIFCLWAAISESMPEKDKNKKGYILLSFLIVIWLALISDLTIKLQKEKQQVPDNITAPAEATATAQQLTTSEIELRQYVLRCSETSNGICTTYDIYRIVKE